ncbi:MAG: hypothetical protein E7522_03185 [Ruminococcaceae bacterium]|nr:hypothetical protein [Oscillospiraceae bacterium]
MNGPPLFEERRGYKNNYIRSFMPVAIVGADLWSPATECRMQNAKCRISGPAVSIVNNKNNYIRSFMPVAIVGA